MGTEIVISGYYGFGNLGDEAILAALIHNIKQIMKDPEIIIFSGNPKYTKQIHHTAAISRINPRKIISTLAKSDLFISGGGSLLQDVTGKKTIPYYLSLLFLAQLLGTKTAFFAQGLGPINSSINRFFISRVLNRVDYISVRDSVSADLLQELNIKKEIHDTVDPVFSFYGRGFSDPIPDSGQEKRLLGLVVRPWRESSYLTSLSRCLNQWDIARESKILIIPFNYDNDINLSQELAEMLVMDCKVLDRYQDPKKLISFFSRLDFLLGVRLHSLIFAALMGVPYLGLSYDPKVDVFVNKFKWGNCISLKKINQNPELLLNKLTSSWQQREELVAELQEKRTKFFQVSLNDFYRVLNLI